MWALLWRESGVLAPPPQSGPTLSSAPIEEMRRQYGNMRETARHVGAVLYSLDRSKFVVVFMPVDCRRGCV